MEIYRLAAKTELTASILIMKIQLIRLSLKLLEHQWLKSTIIYYKTSTNLRLIMNLQEMVLNQFKMLRIQEIDGLI